MLTLLQLNNFYCTNLGFDVTNYYKLWGKEHRFSLQVSSCNDTLRDVTERVLCKVKLSYSVFVKVISMYALGFCRCVCIVLTTSLIYFSSARAWGHEHHIGQEEDQLWCSVQ